MDYYIRALLAPHATEFPTNPLTHIAADGRTVAIRSRIAQSVQEFIDEGRAIRARGDDFYPYDVIKISGNPTKFLVRFGVLNNGS